VKHAKYSNYHIIKTTAWIPVNPMQSDLFVTQKTTNNYERKLNEKHCVNRTQRHQKAALIQVQDCGNKIKTINVY